ncbi:hypothetical protein KM043_000656 [Ampulex compressa]|nr:hypothetical protein KM043_000656 [Ampulex compressa]
MCQKTKGRSQKQRIHEVVLVRKKGHRVVNASKDFVGGATGFFNLRFWIRRGMEKDEVEDDDEENDDDDDDDDDEDDEDGDAT